MRNKTFFINHILKLKLGCKQINYKIIVAILISSVFMIFGLMAMNMEVFEDAWYIESSADGLFGASNVKLSVLCSHFLLTFLIYILSLSGIRLFWFNLFLILGVFISHIINLYILSYKKKMSTFIFEGIFFLTVVTPLLLYQLNMTEIGTYIVTTGCILLLYGLKIKKKWILVGGFMWIAFGGMIRIDCLAFGIIFLGIYLSGYVIIEFAETKFSFHKILKKCKKEFIIGILFLVEVFLLFVTYGYGIDKTNPGFLEWNSVRSYVNDYELPNYEEYENRYKEIGISKKDYQLLKTWNNYDPAFFTLEKYNKINNLRMEVLKKTVKEKGKFYYFKQGMNTIKYQIAYWCILFLFICGIFLTQKKGRILSVLSLLFFHLLIFYFCYRGRLSLHIQHAILVSTIVFLMYILFFERKQYEGRKGYWAIAFLLLLFYKIPYINESISSQYIKMLKAEDSFYSSIDKQYSYSTYSPKIAKEISKDKDNIYFAPVSQIWYQNYPLNVISPFVTAEKGSYSNFAFFSAYMPRLGISNSIFENYEIENPMVDIVNDNVRIVVRKEEVSELIKPLKEYLREHYYKNCDYEIVKVIDECVILKFVEK